MITTEIFDKDRHTHILNCWLFMRKSYIPSPDEMPEYGVVAYDDATPVAMAFLRRMEGNYAQLDGLASNPEASSLQRHEAIDRVVKKIVKHAKQLEIRSLTAYSIDKGALTRALTHGFVHLPHAVMSLDLTLEHK